MNRWALRPTGTFIGRHARISTFMAMDCFCRTDIFALGVANLAIQHGRWA